MPSLFAHATNLVFRCMPQDKPGQLHDYAAERKRNDRKPPRPPKGVTVRLGELGGLSAEFIQKAGNQKGTVFYIHGGGFTVGSARERRAVCQYITARYGYNCVTFNYRLAPENLWPAPLEDCLTAYTALLKTGVSPEEIVFMGESAGGTLVLSLALLLKEKELPQPRALVALSPCVTQVDKLPSYTRNAATDYMLRTAVAEGKIKVVFGSRANDSEYLRQPTISPLYGDFSGLPPVILSASDTEALLDDSKVLYEKLQKQGHQVTLDIRHGVCHAFQVFTAMPEAKQALLRFSALWRNGHEEMDQSTSHWRRGVCSGCRNCGNRLHWPLCRISRACRSGKDRLPNGEALRGL